MTEFEVANPLLQFLVAWTLRWCNDRFGFLVQNIIFHINQAVAIPIHVMDIPVVVVSVSPDTEVVSAEAIAVVNVNSCVQSAVVKPC